MMPQLLICEQYRTPLGEALYHYMDRKGLSPLWLTPDDIVKNLEITLYLDSETSRIHFAYGALQFRDTDLHGIYSTLDYFPSELFGFSSQKDRNYAVMEWHALWLSVLHSVKCRLVNPPAVDALGGAVFSSAEIFDKARKVGLAIPTVLEVESGKIALELAHSDLHLTYTDLGENISIERAMDKEALLKQPSAEHHLRIREYPLGKRVGITIIGSKLFLTEYNSTSNDPLKWTDEVTHKLMQLHKEIHLRVAEYLFCVTNEQQWILYDMKRTLSKESLDQHQEKIMSEIVNLLEGV